MSLKSAVVWVAELLAGLLIHRGFIHLRYDVGAKSNPRADGREADAGFRYAKAAGI